MVKVILERTIVFLKFFIISTVVVLVILNYIPVKFAKRIQIVEQNIENDTEKYICGFTQTTYGDMIADLEDNPSLAESKVFLEIYRNSPFEVLSDEFTTDYIDPTGNKYYFEGRSTVGTFFGLPDAIVLEVDKWDIVYPVRRKTLRGLITPSGYLTIYDFDWKAVMKKFVAG